MTFTHRAQIYDGGFAWDVVLDSSGTVFRAKNYGGLVAYTYDGTSFTGMARVGEGKYTEDVAIAPDGTVFVANDYDGLRAYRYFGTSFMQTAYVEQSGKRARSVAVGQDGTGRFTWQHIG